MIEVLIATLIMVMAIVTVTAAVRQFTLQREKLSHYEHLYASVLSLRDRIMNDTLRDNLQNNGSLNSLEYSYRCKLVESANNYVFGEMPELSGNKGSYKIMLFRVNLSVGGKEFEFFKSQYKKRFESVKDEF